MNSPHSGRPVSANPKSFEDLFRVLGIELNGRAPESVPESELKKGCRQQVSKWHESKFVGKSAAEQAHAAERMTEINVAKGILESPEKIAAHRSTLRGSGFGGFGGDDPFGGSGPFGPRYRKPFGEPPPDPFAA